MAGDNEADAKLLQQVFRMNRDVTKLGMNYARKKEAATEAKKAWEAAQADMTAFINANQAPLFDGADEEEGGGDDEEDEPDFSGPGPALVGSYDLEGNLHCSRCGSADLGPVDGGDPLCSRCNTTVLRAGTLSAVVTASRAAAGARS
jgi:hypothetical protein